MRLSFPDDQEEGLWETMEGWELPMVTSKYPCHLGSFPNPNLSCTRLASSTLILISPDKIQAHPSKIIKLHKFFPFLRTVLAHFPPKWADFDGFLPTKAPQKIPPLSPSENIPLQKCHIWHFWRKPYANGALVDFLAHQVCLLFNTFSFIHLAGIYVACLDPGTGTTEVSDLVCLDCMY